jgi:putative peptide zinc metalloprotease protein
MSAPVTLLPPRRPELVIRPLGEDGRYVVKDPHTGAYFHLGEEEHFLLTQLDGQKDAEAVCAAFTKRFGLPLSPEELDEFVQMVEAQGFLQPPGEGRQFPEASTGPGAHDPRTPAADVEGAPFGLRLLYWRKSIFDPDRLFTWLAPKIGFFWTPAFLVVSAGCIVLAAALLWVNRHEAGHSFLSALRWETAVLAWLTLLVVTTCHEFAHGLTCKRHGGEVHEVGFLLLFFMPCFYCNVSDAWLFKEKSKRLWVTFAGGYFELFLWALAVFVWRLTLPGSLPHYLAFVVLSACGVQTLFNFNPLLKLDGYYLLSDWLEVPNLHQRASAYFKERVRWLLWGAPGPENEPRGKVLWRFGLVSWLYSLFFLGLMLWGLFHFFGVSWGWLGMGAIALLGFVSVRGLFHGFTAGEVGKMIGKRRKRTVAWLLALGSVVAVLCFVPMEDRANGPFHLRPATRAELRAPVAGFLKEVCCDEGDRVSPGAVVARLEVPDLESRLAQKQAEVREIRARLRLLEVGPRPEEVAEQRQRVERARAWRDLAQQDLRRTRQALEEELARLDKQVLQCRAELEAAQDALKRRQVLLDKQTISAEDYQEAKGRQQVCQARLEQAQAEKRARQAKGTLEAEAELARREKELADAGAVLRLLKAGSRAEEIEAEQARLARLGEEVRHLEQWRQKQAVTTPVPGLVTTPRLKEKVGQYLREGDLICLVEEPGAFEAGIVLAEQDVSRVRAGQEVALKFRALPFETCATRVERIAPAAGRGEEQSRVTVYCRLDLPPGLAAEGGEVLRPEMTGYARIYTGRRPIGAILLDRAWRFVRTEFWW